MANILKLKYDKMNFSVIGLGEYLNAVAMQKYIVQLLLPTNSNFTKNVTAFAWQYLSDCLPLVQRNSRIGKSLRNVPLADTFPEITRIDMLIGSDIYADIIREGVYRMDKLSVIAQETAFGCIFKGSLQLPQTTSLNFIKQLLFQSFI